MGARSGTHATARSAKARRVKPSGNLKRYVEAGKTETRILTPLQRHRLALPQDVRNGVVRRADVIHPSYLASGHFCPRAQYFMLVAPVQESAPTFQLDNIFEEGHYIHDKWQGYAWDIGVLAGTYKCVACKHIWLGIAPTECPKCGLDREALRYLEVAVEDTEHNISGSGDGWIVDQIGNAWLEVKSIGTGTVRVEDGPLLKQYSYKDDDDKWQIDVVGLWKAIKRPFPAHIRQTCLYVHCLQTMEVIDLRDIVIIYESKMTQGVKEFSIKYSPEIVEPMLEAAKDVMWAVEKKRPPRCPHGGCKDCKQFGASNGDTTQAASGAVDGERKSRPRRRDHQAEGGTGASGPVSTRPAERRGTKVARRPNSPRRLVADGTDGRDGGLVGLLGRAGSTR